MVEFFFNINDSIFLWFLAFTTHGTASNPGETSVCAQLRALEWVVAESKKKKTKKHPRDKDLGVFLENSLFKTKMA